MDKATILFGVMKLVKELQQRLQALEEAAAGSINDATVRSKALPDENDNNGSRSSTTSASPTAIEETCEAHEA